MINYVPISGSAAIRRHFRDEQEMGPALTVTNWSAGRRSALPEEMPSVSIYK